jgi:hypothetical protein
MTTDPQLYTAVGRLEGKIDLLLSNQTRHDKRLDEQDARIAALETTNSTRKGFFRGAHWLAVATSSVIAFAAPYLKGLFF